MNVANSDSYSITFLACTAFFFSFPLYPQLIDFKHYNSTTIEFHFSVISIGNRMNASAFRDLWVRVMF